MNALLDYFDLDKRSEKSQVTTRSLIIKDISSLLKEKKSTRKVRLERAKKEPQLEALAESIEEATPKVRKELEHMPELVKKMPWWEQILLYMGMLIGVILSSVVTEYMSGNAVELKTSISVLIISAVIALVVIPKAFEYLKFTPDMPLIGRLGLFVQYGVFWNVLLGSIGKFLQDVQ